MDQKSYLTNPERDNPANIEMAYVWTFHETVEKLHQASHLPDGKRTDDFKYILSVLQWQIENYLDVVKKDAK